MEDLQNGAVRQKPTVIHLRNNVWHGVYEIMIFTLFIIPVLEACLPIKSTTSDTLLLRRRNDLSCVGGAWGVSAAILLEMFWLNDMRVRRACSWSNTSRCEKSTLSFCSVLWYVVLNSGLSLLACINRNNHIKCYCYSLESNYKTRLFVSCVGGNVAYSYRLCQIWWLKMLHQTVIVILIESVHPMMLSLF